MVGCHKIANAANDQLKFVNLSIHMGYSYKALPTPVRTICKY